MSRIPISDHGPYLTPEEQRQNDDYEWALRDPEVQAQYRGMIVAVYRKQVLGAGKHHGAATRAALKHPDCPAKYLLAKVYIEGTPLGGDLKREKQP